MKIETIRENIKVFLSKFIKNIEIEDDLEIFSSGLLNSLFAMQLVLFVEKEYQIKIENKDLDIKNFGTVNSIANFVASKVEN